MVSVKMSDETRSAEQSSEELPETAADDLESNVAVEADEDAAGEIDPVTSEPGQCVVFENSFFNCFEEPYFRLNDLRGGEPVFVCKIGNDEMILPFKGIIQECNISDASPDGLMLHSVGQALRYVKAIRPGDELPPELFSDGVSWSVEPRHVALAHQKLSGQLLAWIFEGDANISTSEMIERMATDESTKTKLNEAFGEAAKQLGIAEGGREKVAEMLEELADDLAFIEALREKYNAVDEIQRNLVAIQSHYKGERTTFNLARSVGQLHFKAVKEFRLMFTEVEAQTGEIIAALKNLGAQKRYIRKTRNKLHTRLMPWDDIIAAWNDFQVRKADSVAFLLRNLYQFLAPRYMPVDEWVVHSAPSSRGRDGDFRWDDDDDEFKSPVRAMDWF